MFTCRSCMRRHVHTLLGDSVLYQVEQRTTNVLKNASRATERGYSASSQTWDQRRKPWEAHRTQNSLRSLSERVLRPTEVQKELTYLGDPLKLANHVLNLLRQDRFEEAELLVRTASKSFPCTVSWNHLIDWQLSKGKVKIAIKTYNEMKKRGQKPDAHTFTVIFRGLAEFSHYPEALSKALSIYHSMDAENSPVQPNVIHTNAVLKVCARAKDMDALYGIVAKLRRKGIRAPNNLTYTTILNAIQRQAAEVAKDTEDDVERRSICWRAIREARKLWVEVIERWRQGEIFIDEELTCSMGRVLLMGKEQDVDDIFSLIEQTMNIPRLVPKSDVNLDNQTDSTEHIKAQEIAEESESSLDDDNTRESIPDDEFKAVVRPNQIMRRNDAYAKPGRNALSLVLEALKEIRMSRPLTAYWEVFTNVCKVIPDSNNFHTYLQNLRLRRASSEVVNILQQMPKEMLQMKTFRIAMSTCARDKNNQNSFAHAGKVLDLMQKSLSDMDIPTLERYLEVALYGAGDRFRVATVGSSTEADYARGRRVLRALERLAPCILNVRSALAYNERPDTRFVSKSEPVTDRASALALIREMISAYDKLMSNGMAPQEMNKDLKRERSKLAAFVTRYNTGPKKPLIADKEAGGRKPTPQPERAAPRDSKIWSPVTRVPVGATVG